ncbi:proline-rich domain-containing protein [Anaerotignum sp.]|uniref:proline-rich domain-containing protein n=1 Tax=Anaerotignum sp. TaxID=2039241 RepID=UPI0027155112|nr:proline-rich domain-containing protein [Anaerotignum sp.]
MQLAKIRRTTAFTLAITLSMAIASAGVTANAETMDATQPIQAGDGSVGAPPAGEKPSGAPPSGEAPMGELGTPPSGEAPTGEPGAPPSGEAQTGEVSTEEAPSGNTVTPPSGEKPTGEAPSGEAPLGGNMGGADTMNFDYKGTYSAILTADATSETSENETITALDKDQNAALVQNAGTLTISNDTLNKSGDDTDGDNCNFYGANSILLAVNDSSKAYISDSSLNADSEGSNGIFATDGATVHANNDTITTTAGNSRGLDATYGGTILANLMTISTQGDHSAALATDRGGGYISAVNSKLSTAGSGSPLIYSTGDIEVDNVKGTASGSQIAGMEGLNTILIYHSELTSTCTTASASDPIANGVIIYQSTSGDAESTTGETATFEASDSTLSTAIKSGAMFYSTNTSANIVLSNTTLNFDSSNVNLLTIQGNDSNNWGTAGSNGSDIKFTGLGETLNGNIDVDTISSLDMYLLASSVYTGETSITTNSVNTDVSSAPITINLDNTSTWIVTGNSTVTNLNAEEGSQIVDENGKTVTVVANGSTVVNGTSDYTITVTGNYLTSVEIGSGNQFSTSYIDRTEFDNYYDLSTAFGQNISDDMSVDTFAETESEDSGNSSNIALAAVLAAVIGGAVIITLYVKRRRE